MSTRSRAILDAAMSEADLQAAILDLARLRGWLVAHFRPGRTLAGWRTPIAADGEGFPDLVMLRGERLVVVECKRLRGRVAPAQARWLEAWRAVPGAEVHLWRPGDWAEIERVLR